MPERWLPNPPPYPTSPPLEWPEGSERPPVAPAPVPAAEAGPQRLPLAVVVVAVVLLAALATFAILLLVRPPKKRVAVAPPASGSPATVPSTTAPSLPDSAPGAPPMLTQQRLTNELPGLIAFVEQHRGLAFKAKPTVQLDASAAYVRAWTAYLATDKPLLDHMDVPLTAFGLNRSFTDLVKAQHTWLGDDTVACYDPTTKVLHVRMVSNTPYARQTLVGMLTRALDDQWFSIGRFAPQVGLGEPQFGMATLVSGDDQYLSNTWLAEQSFDDQQSAQAESDDRTPDISDPKLVPVSFARWLSTPDQVGLALVTALREQGGQKALDTAFENPPGGSLQAIDPPVFIDGQQPVPVPMPAADGPVVASGAWGDLLLQDALTSTVDSDLLSAAMTGYVGDATVGWIENGRSCVRIRVASRNINAEQAMQKALGVWMKAAHGSTTRLPDPTRPGRTLVEGAVCWTKVPTTPPSSAPSTTVPQGNGPAGSDPGNGPGI